MGTSADQEKDQFRSQAKRHASQRSLPTLADSNPTFPSSASHTTRRTTLHQAGGLNTHNGRGRAPDATHGDHDDEKSAHLHTLPSSSSTDSPPAASAAKSEDAGPGDSTIESGETVKQKNPMTIARMKAGSVRFVGHFKRAICHSWINVLLVAVPAGIAAEAAHLKPAVVFAINAVAIVPLAGLLSQATESVATRLGDTWGALLNVSFGNAVELIIFIIALVKNEIRIVQASLLGSILANLLLILGMAFLLGGLRFREQIYNSTVTQMSACLLSLSVMSLLLPTAFHASFNETSANSANNKVLKVSRGTSVVLLFIYVLYLLFQLKSHAYMYESMPQEKIDEESHPGVLHDMMNSSSSSDDSSSSDSSSSDSSAGSGSVTATTKRMKRMFKNRRRRKSSASTSTSHTPEIVVSPSAQDGAGYLESSSSQSASRRPSALSAAIHDDADADKEDNGMTRAFDWATRRRPSKAESDMPKRKKFSRKEKKQEKKRLREAKKAVYDEGLTEESPAPIDRPNRVEFAEDVEVAPTPQLPSQSTGRLPFNMRLGSSRGPVRPAFPSILSNNVFVQPAPTAALQTRPAPVRTQSSASGLRRTSSLPDRLNRQSSTPQPTTTQPTPIPRARSVTGRPLSLVQSTTDSDAEPPMSRTAAVMLLLCSTALVAVCAEFMVDAIPEMIENSSVVSEAFIGLIILPIVGNAAEHVTAVTVAAKNKMDLAIGVAVGSSIQIALFVTPIVVLLGWILDTEMSLYFNLFETVSLFVSVFVVNFLVLDGRSNYLEGALLIAAYVIIALGAFFYPGERELSSVGGGAG
ncbi:unnamed protein product [Zymoseptoria tritici ST99CH_1A5]|uniref:Sodium/calcium exchanger membrane region domain-containing protein n=1 Tax=Zymoseptoria tritici ST99CH_1A5 TaxID=1276529 RepID=A0A1Y6LC22_ZYMTR|nr:unnamed protein product [Zymoseptoria tritici ST99CH_1A5]